MFELVTGILFGGILISGLGALSTYTLEEKNPTIKTLSRDFIIGSILFLLIMQLLPESSGAIIAFIMSYIPSVGITNDDIDIEIGMPKF